MFPINRVWDGSPQAGNVTWSPTIKTVCPRLQVS